jgi:hypothetical protein
MGAKMTVAWKYECVFHMFEKSQRKEIKQERRGDRKIRTRRKKTKDILGRCWYMYMTC